ncbi:MAG: 4-hydroxy-tetrahydrodipicolinate reductase, partial [Thermodesulfobacteriota bacterium]
MIKAAILGASGRMGLSIATVLSEEKSIEVVGAVEVSGHSSIGKNLGHLLGNKGINIEIKDNIGEACDSADILIDFT